MDIRWLIAPTALVCAAAPAQAASVANWRATVDEVVADIRATHPDPFLRIGERTFLQAADQLKADLPQLSEEQRVVRVMQLVALLGEAHTQVEPTGEAFKLWYPVRLYQFSDGYFITSAHRSVPDLAGAQVLEIAGRPVDEVMAAARTLFGDENRFADMERNYAAHNAALMRGLGFADADLTLPVRVRLRGGRVVERRLRAHATDNPAFLASDTIFEWVYRAEVFGLPFGTNDDWIAAFGDTISTAFRTADDGRPPFMAQRRRFVSRALPDDDAFYMQINQTDDSEMVTFVRDALAQTDQVRPRRLIIDMRYNFGGDGSRVLEAAHEFVRRESNPPWGEIYLVTGRRNYSAATMLADALADNVTLTTLGEPMGSGWNTFGDPMPRLYEGVGLHLYVSSLWHQLGASDDRRDIVPVDVPALMSFGDYINGRDPAIDPILAGHEMRSITEIVRSDGGAAARSVYLERQRRYGALDWWRPPTEIEMRRACDALVAAERVSDALEACTLTTEMHPFVWNSWYNLASTQRTAGLTREQLSSYRCVLALDPANFNGPQLRQALEQGGDAPLPAGCPAQ